ncbi:hypothetical protein AXA44_42880 [Rhodococcus sp. SC4]|nr:hypothetical protein AXA44_42880 [Rhodococcus sp. SC4]
MTTSETTRVDVGPAELHLQSSGSPTNQSVVFIPGGGGDAGVFDAAVKGLCAQYRCLTYDRRGNSRSVVGDGDTESSIAEQSNDLAETILSVGAAPAIVFGTSWSSLIALELAARRPDLIRGVIVHEVPLLKMLPDTKATTNNRGATVSGLLQEGRYPEAFAAQVRETTSDDAWENLDEGLRARMLANAEHFFTVELPGFASYTPTLDDLAAAPIVVAAGEDGRGVRPVHRASQWLADQLGLPLVELSGGHIPYIEDPDAFVRDLRELIERF